MTFQAEVTQTCQNRYQLKFHAWFDNYSELVFIVSKFVIKLSMTRDQCKLAKHYSN